MKWRIWILSILILVTSLFVFAFTSTKIYYRSTVDKSAEFLRVYMNFFDSSFSLDQDGAKSFSRLLGNARVTFLDKTGNVIADSIANSPHENHFEREEVKDAVFHGEGFAVRGSSTLGKNMIYYCRNFNNEFLVRISVFTDSVRSIFVRTFPLFAIFSVTLIALCLLLSSVAVHFILAPVSRLAENAVHSTEVKSSYSELKPIADILNERNKNIQNQLNEIHAEKELVEKARASKDEFISNVTHEMNTPLTSIHGYAELLDAGGLNEEQRNVAYKTIMTQSERLTNLIACIINYSEIDSDELPPYEVDFSALARETLVALKPEAQKRNITITEEIQDSVILMSRHELLSEIFGNLVRNAIKYNKEGGTICVFLDKNKLVVSDTGIGIAQQNMGKVFSRFFTVDKSHNGKNGGFGLGLAVVKKICKKSGWNISVESTLGKGSAFTVEFS